MQNSKFLLGLFGRRSPPPSGIVGASPPPQVADIENRLARIEALLEKQGQQTAASLNRLETGVDGLGGLLQQVESRVVSTQASLRKLRTEIAAGRFTNAFKIFIVFLFIIAIWIKGIRPLMGF